jgi:DMSO reductase anchor subunit
MEEKERVIRGDWSLIAFSFLTTLSVAIIISSLIKGIFPKKLLFFSIIVMAGLISLLHMGRGMRAWRSVANLKKSLLSREIAMFLVYSALSIPAVILQVPGFLFFLSITGLILLISVDSVYIYSDRNKSVILHSGQTFLSALFIVSFFTGIILPFVFTGIIKLAASFNNFIVRKSSVNNFTIRFLRIALLLITGASFISGISYPGLVISILFLIGELLDRIIFYIDFSPVNINSEIIKQLNIERIEKERG